MPTLELNRVQLRLETDWAIFFVGLVSLQLELKSLTEPGIKIA